MYIPFPVSQYNRGWIEKILQILKDSSRLIEEPSFCLKNIDPFWHQSLSAALFLLSQSTKRYVKWKKYKVSKVNKETLI